MKKYLTIIIGVFMIFSASFYTFAQDSSPSSKSQGENTNESEDVIRERVKEKLELAKNNPKAVLGKVNDILETSLRVEKDAGEVQIITLDKNNTTFVDSKNSPKNIGFSDIAIGDFLIAMGYLSQNGSLEAKRILVSAPLEKPTRQILFGEVVEIKGKTTTLKVKGNEVELTFPRRWKGPEIEDLKEGNTLAVVAQVVDGSLTVRTIEIITLDKPTLSPQEEN